MADIFHQCRVGDRIAAVIYPKLKKLPLGSPNVYEELTIKSLFRSRSSETRKLWLGLWRFISFYLDQEEENRPCIQARKVFANKYVRFSFSCIETQEGM